MLDTNTIFLIVIGVFLVMLVIEVPIGHALGLSGLLGITLTRSYEVGLATLGNAAFNSVASYGLSIVPMYVLVGMFALRGRIAEHVFTVADRLIGRVRGGLGMATVAACAGFAAVTGSSVATAATVGRLAVGEMRQRGYPDSIAAGIVAAAGTLGILIPPSIILALYGVITGESIAALLTAGILPGILSAVVFGIYIFIRHPEAKRRQVEAEVLENVLAGGGADRAPSGKSLRANGTGVFTPAGATPPAPRVSLRDLPWRGPVKILILFALVMGGVYTGWFTVTESGALGALFAALMMGWELRKERGRQILRNFALALRETAATTSMSFFLLIGSTVFTFYLVSAGIPTAFARWVVALEVPPAMVVIILLLAMIPLGMALDSLSILIIIVPLAYPVISELGFDGVWFAILFVKLIELGQITPPVGINVFIVSGVSGVKAERVFRGILPFAILDLVLVAILFVFPDIALFLPRLLLGG